MKSPIHLYDELKAKRFVQKIPRYDPIKGLGNKSGVQKTDGLSEYQAAYRIYPSQPRRKCVYPVQNKKDYSGSTKLTTTYKQDYVRHDDKDVKGESFKPDQKYNKSSSKFGGVTIYQMSYNNFDKETIKQCRRSPIRPGDPRKPIEGPYVPVSKQEVLVSKQDVSVSKEDVQMDSGANAKHLCGECQASNPGPADVMQPTGDAKEQPFFNRKITITKTTPGSKSKIQYTPFEGITTFMADYPKHPYAPRQPACKPPLSNNHYMHTEDAAFDGKTTQNIAYKAWPVSPPEKPLWAIKPEYKRISGGMPFDSTYMADYRDPRAMSRVMPIKPTSGNDIIKHVNGDGDPDCNTTYQVNFLKWTGAMPAQTFHVKQIYVPPETDMDLQSTQRTHFKGDQTERSQLCRKISEHRQLNDDKRMHFSTTYKDTYRDNRPKSSPATFTVPTSCKICKSPIKRKKEDVKDSLNDSGFGSSGEMDP